MNLEQGFDFILSHLVDGFNSLFPRRISTKLTNNVQVLVNSREEALSRFKQSDYIDCRISAYSAYTDHHGRNTQQPNFIFIDLDQSGFKTQLGLKRGLNKTLRNITYEFSGNPSVLWTGNGYHIYQPIDALVLEGVDDFSVYENPSNEYLRFAERHLSENKSDPNHTPSLKSCMIRVPGSLNSKNDQVVRVVNKWDGNRPRIGLLGTFYAYLHGRQIKKEEERLLFQRQQPSHGSGGMSDTISWIESLLQIPVDDGRKMITSLILAPYLCNIRHLPFQESADIIKEWLGKCRGLRGVDFNIDKFVKYRLDQSIKDGFKPMKRDTLVEKHHDIWKKLAMLKPIDVMEIPFERVQ